MEGLNRGVAITARFWDEEQRQTPELLRVPAARCAIIAFATEAGDTFVQVGATPREHMGLVRAVVSDALGRGVNKLALALEIARALEKSP